MCSIRRWLVASLVGLAALSPLYAGDGNRLTYLDENNPYYPHVGFPKLTTPQWIGEDGVAAVVILAIDDMRKPQKYEDFLRPILIRLKQIDGRAPVSIMTCNVDPNDEQLQQWLAEGLSIEVHTIDHPCPLLQGGDFNKAKSTYDRCVDLLNRIPNNGPVAFRMPCCDSLNTVSPRFYAEIFGKTTASGHYLQASSSVFNLFTSDDPDIPRELVQEADGSERFRKYIPKNLNRDGAVSGTFVNTIENYPYPYVINRVCWEFPCVVPSDWEAQHLHGKNNSKTVQDLKAALDVTVIKRGVMNLVFHPHGWIRNDQIVELIDHAVKTHGKKVKFLTFQDAVERLNKNLLAGRPLRASGGGFSGTRVVDLNADGYMDVAASQTAGSAALTRIWQPDEKRWSAGPTPHVSRRTAEKRVRDSGCRFAVVTEDGSASVLLCNEQVCAAQRFGGTSGGANQLLQVLEVFRPASFLVTAWNGRDFGVRFRDLDGDGICEMLATSPAQRTKAGNREIVLGGKRGIYRRSTKDNKWSKLPFDFPPNTAIVDAQGRDAGLRFVDLNEDGHDDVVFANHQRYGIWLWGDMQTGWSIEVLSGVRTTPASGGRQPPVAPDRDTASNDKENAQNARAEQAADAPRSPLPPIVRNDGSDNGFFVHSRHLFWQNEDTADLPNLVDRRSFNDLLKETQPGPKSPNASLNSIRTRPGFQVELVAAEPLVMDPVAFDWGADGKLWVVEMADYPLGIPPNEPARSASKGRDVETLAGAAGWAPGGRVRFLEDTDGDGRYDKSTVFLDGVRFPNGILPWKKGVIVTAAPDIFYAEDTDGDGKADKREVLFTGFAEGNQQHRVNGLVYGLDNWVYLANGDSGGVIRPVLRNPASSRSRVSDGDVINIGSMDLRIRPDTREIDLQAGRTQFGRNRDDWGNWFGSNNSNPLWHYVLADHYVRRNPHFPSAGSQHPVSVAPGAAPCFPISRTLERFNDFDKANRFTSACSAIVYRDELFGPHFIGNSFVSEPVHNLVHREVMQPDGYSFTSRRAAGEETSEFLASSDNWFRPTMIKTGPEGGLWIADMYRHVIEHPKWIPESWQKRLDLRAGDDRGRIYRVIPVTAKPQAIPRLDRKTTAELVTALRSANGWQRDTAQRLLIERHDPAAVRLLRAAVKRDVGSDSRAAVLGRLHALCTLDGLSALSEDVLAAGLADPHPGVRRHAVRLCESLEKTPPGIVDALAEMVDDEDPQVRLQLASTLGEIEDPRAAAALGKLLLADPDADSYLTRAAMSSINARNIEQVVLALLSSPDRGKSAVQRQVSRLMPMAAAFGRQKVLFNLLDRATAPTEGRYEAWQLAAVGGLILALERQGTSLDDLKRRSDEDSRSVIRRVEELQTAARSLAADETTPLDLRTAAVGLQERGSLDLLASLLAPQNPSALQQAAAERLGQLGDDRVPAILISGWRSFGPQLKESALDVLLARRSWQDDLLDSVEKGRILPREFDAARRQKLLQRPTAIRERAARLFADSTQTDRRRLIADYRAAPVLPGDPTRGAVLFEKHCAQCHKLGGVGFEVGPDLKSLTDKSAEALLVAVLDPNRAVETKYVSYTAVTRGGLTLTGLLAAESGNSITLKEAKGKEHVILRTDLQELVSSAKSTMPEGLEKELKPQDLADLFLYVRSNLPEGEEPAQPAR